MCALMYSARSLRRRLLPSVAASLFCPFPAWAASEAPTTIEGYLFRMSLALIGIGACAWLALRFAQKRGLSRPKREDLCLLATLPLGHEVVYLIRCGPDVVAFASGKNGTLFLGRWSLRDWEDKSGDVS